MNYIKLIILIFIEIFTEFIPVSSTGHMIILSYLINLPKNEFIKLFIIIIQLGPIISLSIIYKKLLLNIINFSYKKILIALIPTIIIGIIFNKKINYLLDNYILIAIFIILGGITLIIIDNILINKNKYNNITYYQSIIIGIFQSFAIIPGISRSAASIIGGLIQNISIKTSISFSFILAIPTILSAIIKKIFDFYIKGYLYYIKLYHKQFYYYDFLFYFRNRLSFLDLKLLFIGNIISFILSIIIINYFISYLNKYNIQKFGYYRIIIGIIVIILFII